MGQLRPRSVAGPGLRADRRRHEAAGGGRWSARTASCDANEILREASAYIIAAKLAARSNDHRADYGIEPVSNALPIAPSIYHAS